VTNSEEDDEGMKETLHLLKSPANAERLRRSIEEANQGMAIEHELIDPDAAESSGRLRTTTKR
jgi:antitoxin YefM